MTARIDKYLEAYLKTCFPDRSKGIRAVYKPGSWQSNRYLQVPTILTDDRYLHYEYCGGFVELHLEGKYQTAPFASFARRLREKTSDDSRLTWHSWQGNKAYRCRIDSPTGDWGQLREAIREIMAIFDPIINEINKQGEMEEKNEPYQGDSTFEEEGLDKESVCLASACLGKLFNNKLIIPDYQRNYCWQDKQVRQSNRYLQVPTILTDDRYLHYEYCGGFVELHLEGKYQTAPFASFARRLREKTSDDSRLTWHSWQGNKAYRCRIDSPTGDWGQLREAIREIMAIFDPIINEINKQGEMEEKNEPYQGDSTFEEEGLDKESVCLASACLGKLFNNKLIIPDYQRNYCWQDKQVNDLWNSLKEIPNDKDSPYHLGTIILQKRADGTYSVIDGQQRLVTLSLIVRQLGYRGDIPLLSQKFLSQQSRDHIANARYLIDHLVETDRDTSLCQRIIKQLEFTVLILKESKLDLAYTFFSNENSKGVPLSDYDLLKAHHLRYISSEEQAEHLAGRWNRMIENDYPLLEQTAARYLLPLRKWMRKQAYDPNRRLCVKDEFSTAPTLAALPAFGESFHFYEKIQGGTHFFVFMDTFTSQAKSFGSLRAVKALRRQLQAESHWKFAEVIEALLFGYYLKFGEQYLPEALYSIASNIAQSRYATKRALTYKIRQSANDSEIIMMIDQASSPTFFLAECLLNIKDWGQNLEGRGIARRFHDQLQRLFRELKNDFTEPTIIAKINHE